MIKVRHQVSSVLAGIDVWSDRLISMTDIATAFIASTNMLPYSLISNYIFSSFIHRQT